MQTIARAALRPDASGAPLPTVYQAFARAGVFPRAGEVSLIAAPPGNGKSSLALDYAVKVAVPTLYFSCDSDAWTMGARLAAMRSGKTLREVEMLLENDHEWSQRTLGEAHLLRWVFDSAPTLGDIELELAAYDEVMGRPPELVVVDNLVDLTHDDGSGNEYSAWKSALKELKWMARDTGAAFIVLHHTNEHPINRKTGEPPSRCPSRTDVSGKVNQHPALVLTMSMNTPGVLDVCPVKNRHGQAHPNGDWALQLRFWPENMQIGDLV